MQRKANSLKKNSFFTITITGTIHAFKGSPDKDGDFWILSGYPPDDSIVMDSRQTAIQNKIGALVDLFETENRWFEAISPNGEAPMKFLGRKKSMNFENGPWVETCRYTIVLEAECIWFGDREVCAFANQEEPVDETWDIEASDESMRSYRLTHTASAQYPDSRNTDGTLNIKGHLRAKEAVEARLGINYDRLEQSGVLNLSDFDGYNHARNINENVAEGSYRVVETWLCTNITPGQPACLEDYTTTLRDNGGILTASIEGRINGFFIRDSDFQITTTKITNADAKWALVAPLLFSRCQAVTTRVLNPVSIGQQKVRDSINGVISYSFEYNTKSNFGLTDARQVNVNIQDILPHDIFAEITVINRASGPINQSIGTITNSRRTISIDVLLNPIDYGDTLPATVPDVSAIIAYYTPVGYSQIFLAENTQSFILAEGRYQRNVTYTYQ